MNRKSEEDEMGTSAITRIYDWHDNLLLVIYRQSDGYPTGHGTDIKRLIGGHVLVNGYNSATPIPFANGMDCLAAQLVAGLKSSPGQIYIHPPHNPDPDWAEYTYELRGADPGMGLGATRPTLKVARKYDSRVLFDGPIQDFDPEACEREEDEE